MEKRLVQSNSGAINRQNVWTYSISSRIVGHAISNIRTFNLPTPTSRHPHLHRTLAQNCNGGQGRNTIIWLRKVRRRNSPTTAFILDIPAPDGRCLRRLSNVHAMRLAWRCDCTQGASSVNLGKDDEG